MSLTPGRRRQLERWINSQLQNIPDADTALSSYILEIIACSPHAARIWNGEETAEASAALQAELNEQLNEFLEQETVPFVSALCLMIQQLQQSGADAEEAVDEAAANASAWAQEGEAGYVEYDPAEEGQYEVGAVDSSSGSGMADADATAESSSKRKRAAESSEQADNDADTLDAPLAAPTNKRARHDGASSRSVHQHQHQQHQQQRPCFEFQRRGTCSRGANCHYEHTPRPPQQQQMQMPMQMPAAFPAMHGAAPMMMQPHNNAPLLPLPQMMNGGWNPQMQQQQQQWMMQQQYQQRMVMQHQQHQQQTMPQSHDGSAHAGLGYHPSTHAAVSHVMTPSTSFVQSSTPEMPATHFTNERKQGVEREADDDEDEYLLHAAVEPVQQSIGDSGMAVQPASSEAQPVSFSAVPPPASYSTRGRAGMRGGRGRGRGGSSSSASVTPSSEWTRLYVTHIPADLNNLVSLSTHFSQFGSVVAINKLDDERAIVKMSTHTEAKSALESEKAVLDNRFIQVEWAKESGTHAHGHGEHGAAHQPHRVDTGRRVYHTKPPFVPSTAAPAAVNTKPPAAPLSALEVARALMAQQKEQQQAQAQAQAQANAQQSTEAETSAATQPESEHAALPAATSTDALAVEPAPTPADTSSSSSSTAPSTAASVAPSTTSTTTSAASLSTLRANLISRLQQQRKDLLARLDREKGSMKTADRQALMRKLADVSGMINKASKENGAPTSASTAAPASTSSAVASSSSSSTPALATTTSPSSSSSPDASAPKKSALEVAALLKAKQAALAQRKQEAEQQQPNQTPEQSTAPSEPQQ